MENVSPARILLVDDDEDDYVVIRDLLAEISNSKLSLDWEPAYEAARTAMARNSYDVYLLDYRLGKQTGLDLLREAISGGCKAPVIFLTGYGDQEVDLKAMQIGAADYLVKTQITAQLLERSIRYSIYRKQSEAQILLQDRLASIGLLASSLAHEIGTPLGVIRGRAEYLGFQVGENENLKKNLDIIVSQIDRVSKLIRSLLNLARGNQTGNLDAVLLNSVVSEVVELMGHELRKFGIQVENRLTVEARVQVRAEAESLHQVVLNLLVNAVHAIEVAIQEGRQTGHFIRIQAQEVQSQWMLNIQDSGCGISRANLGNLFKPFFTTKDIGVGTGLGLVTCYRIIQSWGGSIQVESQEGAGTTFHVFLPKQAK